MRHGLCVVLVAVAMAFVLATPIRHDFRETDADLFAGWRAGTAKREVIAIEAYLAREGVGNVLPLGDILRSDAR